MVNYVGSHHANNLSKISIFRTEHYVFFYVLSGLYQHKLSFSIQHVSGEHMLQDKCQFFIGQPMNDL